MAIYSYSVNNENLWSVYVNIRHKECPGVRRQKKVNGLKSECAALQEEKKLIRLLTHEVNEIAERGVRWGELVDLWEVAMRSEKNRSIAFSTYVDNLSALHRWTKTLWHMHAKEISIGDWRQVFREAEAQGRSRSFAINLKAAINGIYRFGLEENRIRGMQQLPTEFLQMKKKVEEKPPQILTLEEIRKLLREAKRADHQWYSIWAVAILTGMRAGELNALLWSDLDFDRGIIIVSKSYNPRFRITKSTKAGYWRNVPISTELKSFLLDLKATSNGRKEVFHRFREWTRGEQARPLRLFCREIGIPEVKFHTLRACFATQLLANGVQSAKVMKICGWRDLATMERYIRLAGIDEMGATEGLKVIDSTSSIMAEVVNFGDFKASRESKMEI